MPLAPMASLLDPRPLEAALAAPLRDAVNLPADEISRRSHELPPPGVAVRVADVGREVEVAFSQLAAVGRAAVTAPAVPGGTGWGRLWRPSEFLVRVLEGRAPGLALDLGCGAGREAVALAGSGWRVTAVDSLPEVVSRGAAMEARYLRDAPPIAWRTGDYRLLEGPGDADLVLMLFTLDRETIRRMADGLKSGASLVMEAFSPAHRERHAHPAERWTLSPSEVPELLVGLRVECLEESKDPNRGTVRVLATKP